jgi:signal transduction histidine kinase
VRRVEVESFIKSFLLFSSSLGLLIAILFYLNYTKEAQTLDETLFSQMRVCSYDLKCEQFVIDFVPRQKQIAYTLYKENGALSSYYPIPGSDDFVMKISLGATQYEQLLSTLRKEAYLQFLGTLIIIFILSALFSFYALYPLRNALNLTQEFIKDILHDFNTPLGALRLNSAMLKREIGENKKLERIEQSVQNVLDLQENLRAYLHDHEQQKETFSLKTLAQERIALIEKGFDDIRFSIEIDDVKLHTNKAAFKRILDNLLSNAAKYNRPNGTVTLAYDPIDATLKIIDTGKGIKAPKRIFDRFYKEQERGIGIGLHIVKKLCDELKIRITVESTLDKGSTFTLSLRHLLPVN